VNRKVYIALPAYSGLVDVMMAHALIVETHLFSERGDGVMIQPMCGFADLRYVKNLMISLFLETDCTDFFLVDYDLVWDKGAMVKLMDYDEDFVTGVYPARKDPIMYQMNYVDSPNMISDKTGELVQVYSSPGGFWRIKREGLEKMIAHYPELEFTETRVSQGKCYDLFGHILEDKILYGEDVAFCKRWNEMGGKVWAKPDITFKHIGKKEFIGNFGDWLRGDRE
jgi:hypothetical protein